jgi:hypothetical protein
VKKIIAIIFLIAFSLQTFYTAGVIVWFFANQKILAQKHCVNKKRPVLQCNGKCFLSKKIKEAEQKENKKEFLQVKWVEPVPCTITEISYQFNPAFDCCPAYRYDQENYYFRFKKLIFHPPPIS